MSKKEKLAALILIEMESLNSNDGFTSTQDMLRLANEVLRDAKALAEEIQKETQVKAA